MTPTPAKRTENAGGPPRLGWFVAGSLVLVVALELGGRYAEESGIAPPPSSDVCSLLAASAMALSMWYVLNRVFQVRKITQVTTLGAVALVVSQALELADNLAFLQPLFDSLSSHFPYVVLVEMLFLSGLALFFGAFYLCIFETEAAKARVAKEREALADQVGEREQAEVALRESESLLRATLDSTADGILAVDSTGSVTHANARFAAMWRIPQTLLDARDDKRLLDHALDQLEDPAAFLAKVERLYQTADEDLDTLEFKDGRLFERFSRPLVQQGEIVGRVWSFRDVTDRKQAEAALEEERNLLQTLIDNMPDYIYVKDRESRFIINNVAHLRVLGLATQDEATGKTDFDVFPRELAEKYYADEQDIVRTGQPLINREEITIGPDGNEEHLLTTKVPMCDVDGQITGFVGVCRNITERKLAEEALRASEERFREIAQSSKEWIWEVDANGLYTYASPVSEEILGYKPEEIVGKKHFYDLFHPDDREEVKRAAFAVFANKDTFRDSINRNVAKNGNVVWFSTAGVPMLDEHGNLVGYRGADSDITERRRAEEELRENAALLHALMDNIPDNIYFKDTALRFTKINRAQAALIGLSDPAEAVGTDDSQYFTPEHARRVREQEMRIVETGEPLVDFTEQDEFENGRSRWVSTTQVPICNDKGEVVALVGISRDITERRRIQEERSQLEAKVQEAQKYESLGVLAGGIAHDFNNLLMGILGNADLALMDLPTVSPARDRVRKIEMTAKRAADLAQQMLAYSGKGRFLIEPIDLGRAVSEMGHLLEASLSKKAILKYRLAEQLPAIGADATQVSQVIMNLITNASEALGDEEGVVSISTGALDCDQAYLRETYFGDELPEGPYVYLEVTDTGCGMAEEVRTKIFDPFFTTKFTGRGLGLAAVLGIVRGHNGGIRIYSEPGRGTTFRVLFPGLASEAKPRAEGQAVAADWHTTGTVLLVDDERAVLDVAKSMLEKFGFEVLTAADGREAVEVFRDHADAITCVLLDLTMPHMDGEETFRALRQIRVDVPVILSSGYNEQDVTQRFAGQGLAGFIQKPYQSAGLAEKLRTVLPDYVQE